MSTNFKVNDTATEAVLTLSRRFSVAAAFILSTEGALWTIDSLGHPAHPSQLIERGIAPLVGGICLGIWFKRVGFRSHRKPTNG